MNSDDLKDALNRLEDKLDSHMSRIEPIINEYHASKLLKRKISDGMKTMGMVIALALSGITLKEKIQAPVVKTSQLPPE